MALNKRASPPSAADADSRAKRARTTLRAAVAEDDTNESDDDVLHACVEDDIADGTGRRADDDPDAHESTVDCAEVYTQARSAAAAAFVLGAGREGRPHQVDAVAKLMSLLWLDRHVAETRPINYLVQHATGTGKSLTIAVLALQLLCFCTDGTFLRRTDSEEDGFLAAEQQGGRGDGDASRGGGGGGNMFSCVVILTDRLQLDKQLGDTVGHMPWSYTR